MQEQASVGIALRKQPNSAVALDIKVPPEMSKEYHKQVLAELGKTTQIPGFRKGKATTSALTNFLGAGKVKKATVEQIIDAAMRSAGNQVQLNTCGEARLSEDIDDLVDRFNVGEGCEFTLLVDVYPEVPLDAEVYQGLTVEVERIPFNQEAYDNSIRKLRKQHADLIDAEEGAAAQLDEQIQVNMESFEAKKDGSIGKPLPPVAGGENIPVPLVAGQFVPGMVERLVGIKVGEMREVKITFPVRSSVPQLAGKDAIFKVTCLKVQRKQLPELNDAFANKVKPGMTFAELDEKLREGVEQATADNLRKSTHAALAKALVATLPETFEVPDSLVENLARDRFAEMLASMREQGETDEKLRELVSPENYERYKKITRPMSINQIKADFAIKEVGRQQRLVLERSRVDDEIVALQAQALQRREKFKESEVRPQVENALEKEMVLDWLQARAQVNLVDPSEKEDDVEEMLGATPEELAASMTGVQVPASPQGEEAPATDVSAADEVVEATATEEADTGDDGGDEAVEVSAEEESGDTPSGTAPDGFSWGGTF